MCIHHASDNPSPRFWCSFITFVCIFICTFKLNAVTNVLQHVGQQNCLGACIFLCLFKPWRILNAWPHISHVNILDTLCTLRTWELRLPLKRNSLSHWSHLCFFISEIEEMNWSSKVKLKYRQLPWFRTQPVIEFVYKWLAVRTRYLVYTLPTRIVEQENEQKTDKYSNFENM